MKKFSQDIVLIIDFGSQVTQLIARRVQEVGARSKIISFKYCENFFSSIIPKSIILSGGPSSVTDINVSNIPKKIYEFGIPILGICYGEQIMCVQLGGKVAITHKKEFGKTFLHIQENSPLFDGVWKKGSKYPVWMSHSDSVTVLPNGFHVIGTSENSPFAAVADEKRNFYGVQFHPEMEHTPDGKSIISNFIYNISNIKDNWKTKKHERYSIKNLQKEIGNKKVICGLSGGIDSAATAILIHRAIGKNLICIFIDNGFMRKNESEDVINIFRKHYDIPLLHVDASDLFINSLKGIINPEKKRKIIGKIFIEVFEKESKKIEGEYLLAQGTLYPDIIESISPINGGSSSLIKSHHNVGGLPNNINIKIIEPLRDLFKYEVRNLSRKLGLPEYFINRQPFPGPGLAIRCPGVVTRKKLSILREADAIYLDEIYNDDLYDKIWQAFAVLLPVKTVGVMGDRRTYEYACVLRAITSSDGMTADFYKYKMDFLGRVSRRIINEVSGINRVVYDITSKPPGTIEWE